MTTQSATDRVEPSLHAERVNVDDRPIGRILVDMGKLRPVDVERICVVHREKGLRFGEAARKLRLLKDADIQQALSIQFNYPYLRAGQSALSPELLTAREPFDPQSETFRDLRTQLLLHWIGAEHKVLAVVSPDTGDGRSFLAANLAVAFAQLGENTLLIDADMRRPKLHRLFGHSNGPGLAQILSGRSGVEAAERVSYFDSLWLLSAGAAPPNPLELLSRPMFSDLLDEARKRFKIVLLDTPASSRGADSRITAARSDGVLAVARQDHTRLADIENLYRVMRASGAQVAGTVLNRI